MCCRHAMDESFTGSLASFGSLGSTGDFDEVGTGSDSRLRQALQDQVLRSLMVQYGLLEDVQAGPSMTDAFASATLREMRRTGSLGGVSEDAQATLLGSTLYEYSDLAPPLRAMEVRLAALGGTTGAAAPSPLATTAEEFAGIRSGLDRILAGEASAASLFNSTINSRDSALFGDTVRYLRRESRESASPVSPSSPAVVYGSGRDATSPTAQLLEGNLTLLEEEVLRMIRTGGSVGGAADASSLVARSDAALGESLPQALYLGNSMASSHLADTEDILENTVSSSGLLVGLGGASQEVFSETMQSGYLEETFGGMLQRLAGLDMGSLDDSLARGVRRVLQMGAVLAGARLAEDEIGALPKVRFQQAEEQQCSICLESFRSGELLTELPCRHFFHVECVANWFQRSTRCPLCRSGCHITVPGEERGSQSLDA